MGEDHDHARVAARSKKKRAVLEASMGLCQSQARPAQAYPALELPN